LFQYFVRRLLWAIVMLLLVISVVFAIFFLVPGGAGRRGPEGVSPVAVAFAGKQPTPDVLAEIEERFGLDQPIYVQYGRYVWDMVRFWEPDSLGYSYQTEEPVKEAIFRRLPATVSLAVGASIIWLFLGVALGIISALKRRTLVDRGSMLFALAGVSMPTFWLGLIVVFFFDATLDIYNTGSYVGPFEDPIQWFEVMWLPWLVLAIVSAAFYTRMVRGNMLEVENEDYIRTARAKGLKRRGVIRHQLRSALAPVVTMYGLDLGLLLGGAVITEQIFSIPGIGAFAVDAIQSGNLPVIIGTTVLASAFVIIMNLIVDMLYAVLDPRVAYS
jgi:ABC-type dipeptide/oligopeptide/nickel transport system permease component